MKDATLAQGNQVISLIRQKKLSSDGLQKLIGSGLLSDIMDADTTSVNRRELQRFLSLSPLVKLVEVTTVDNRIVRAMVDTRPFLPFKARDLVLPDRVVGQKRSLLLLDITVEDFLPPEDEDIDRNIEDLEALREMRRRAYSPCGLADLVDLLEAKPELKLKTSGLSIVAFETFRVGDKDIPCVIVWQCGWLTISSKMDGTCGGNCRFLATRQFGSFQTVQE